MLSPLQHELSFDQILNESAIEMVQFVLGKKLAPTVSTIRQIGSSPQKHAAHKNGNASVSSQNFLAFNLGCFNESKIRNIFVNRTNFHWYGISSTDIVSPIKLQRYCSFKCQIQDITPSAFRFSFAYLLFFERSLALQLYGTYYTDKQAWFINVCCLFNHWSILITALEFLFSKPLSFWKNRMNMQENWSSAPNDLVGTIFKKFQKRLLYSKLSSKISHLIPWKFWRKQWNSHNLVIGENSSIAWWRTRQFCHFCEPSSFPLKNWTMEVITVCCHSLQHHVLAA